MYWPAPWLTDLAIERGGLIACHRACSYQQARGQLALRFPGDACAGAESCECPPEHFEAVRKGWHIDGCPNDFIPGTTDHYGRIQHFDALVGVLLSDVRGWGREEGRKILNREQGQRETRTASQ